MAGEKPGGKAGFFAYFRLELLLLECLEPTPINKGWKRDILSSSETSIGPSFKWEGFQLLAQRCHHSLRKCAAKRPSWPLWGGVATTIKAISRRDLFWGVIQYQAIIVV